MTQVTLLRLKIEDLKFSTDLAQSVNPGTLEQDCKCNLNWKLCELWNLVTLHINFVTLLNLLRQMHRWKPRDDNHYIELK